MLVFTLFYLFQKKLLILVIKVLQMRMLYTILVGMRIAITLAYVEAH